MINQDLDNLVEILRRRIYTENIQFYENAFYQQEPWQDKVISESDYSVAKIKYAILKNLDLNKFGENNGQKCIFSDLNKYLKMVKHARMIPEINYIQVLSSLEIASEILRFMHEYIETHTEEENLVMKKIFLEKMGYSLDENLNADQIEYLFTNAYEKLNEPGISYRRKY